MKKHSKKIKKICLIVLGIILLVSVFLDTYLLLKYNILPVKYLVIYEIIVGLIPILLIMFTIFKKKKSKFKVFCIFLEVIYIIVLWCAFFYLNQTFNFIDDFTSGFEYETKNYYVVSLNNSSYNKIDDLVNKNIGYVKELDTSSEKAIEELSNTYTFTETTVDGYGELFDRLEAGTLDGALIVQSYYDVLRENDETINDKYKLVHKFFIKEKAEELGKDVDVTKETFVAYLSGIDSYDSVTDQKNSDVNIIASINPKTYKIILITIPRDYYIDLAGYGAKDKLTHAGGYGVKTSVKTIEDLLDTEINYYVKVNFNALVDLVDALGGVDVESEYDFYSYEFRHHFRKGMNHVNGKYALDFVRTRKAFVDGDRVRGENQQRMIKAIFEKAKSPSVLIKYGDLLKALSDNFITNISTDKITSLINMQLDKNPKWEIETMSLNGSDAKQLCYSYPTQELYVMIPNEETVEAAKAALESNK